MIKGSFEHVECHPILKEVKEIKQNLIEKFNKVESDFIKLNEQFDLLDQENSNKFKAINNSLSEAILELKVIVNRNLGNLSRSYVNIR